MIQRITIVTTACLLSGIAACLPDDPPPPPSARPSLDNTPKVEAVSPPSKVVPVPRTSGSISPEKQIEVTKLKLDYQKGDRFAGQDPLQTFVVRGRLRVALNGYDEAKKRFEGSTVSETEKGILEDPKLPYTRDFTPCVCFDITKPLKKDLKDGSLVRMKARIDTGRTKDPKGIHLTPLEIWITVETIEYQ